MLRDTLELRVLVADHAVHHRLNGQFYVVEGCKRMTSCSGTHLPHANMHADGHMTNIGVQQLFMELLEGTKFCMEIQRGSAHDRGVSMAWELT